MQSSSIEHVFARRSNVLSLLPLRLVFLDLPIHKMNQSLFTSNLSNNDKTSYETRNLPKLYSMQGQFNIW
jgi:hypothetical protein